MVIASTHEDAEQEIERRIAAGRFDPGFGALVILPDLPLDEWEARQRERQAIP